MSPLFHCRSISSITRFEVIYHVTATPRGFDLSFCSRVVTLCSTLHLDKCGLSQRNTTPANTHRSIMLVSQGSTLFVYIAELETIYNYTLCYCIGIMWPTLDQSNCILYVHVQSRKTWNYIITWQSIEPIKLQIWVNVHFSQTITFYVTVKCDKHWTNQIAFCVLNLKLHDYVLRNYVGEMWQTLDQWYRSIRGRVQRVLVYLGCIRNETLYSKLRL